MKHGTETASLPSGPMQPESEAAVREQLAHAKLDATDQSRALMQLSKSPYGARAAELISRGHLSDIPNYDKVLKQFKDKTMAPAATMALEHATELQERGIPASHLKFEIDESNGLDLDVATLKDGGRPDFGYQLKDVKNIAGINSAIRKTITQLRPDGADFKVAILDIHQPEADMTPELLRKVEYAAGQTHATYQLRFTDGSITIPDDGPIYP